MVSYRIFENQVKNSKIIFINTYILLRKCEYLQYVV